MVHVIGEEKQSYNSLDIITKNQPRNQIFIGYCRLSDIRISDRVESTVLELAVAREHQLRLTPLQLSQGFQSNMMAAQFRSDLQPEKTIMQV